MSIRFDLVEGPAVEPVVIAGADGLKEHAKIETSADDARLTGFLKSARMRVEQATGRALITQEWTATLDRWPAVEDGERHRRIRLAHFPIQSIDSVTVDGVALAASYYRLDGKDLQIGADATDSEDLITSTGIVIAYTAGYGDSGDDVPNDLLQAVKQLATHYDTSRGATSPQGIYHQLIPEGVQALLIPYVVLEV